MRNILPSSRRAWAEWKRKRAERHIWLISPRGIANREFLETISIKISCRSPIRRLFIRVANNYGVIARRCDISRWLHETGSQDTTRHSRRFSRACLAAIVYLLLNFYFTSAACCAVAAAALRGKDERYYWWRRYDTPWYWCRLLFSIIFAEHTGREYILNIRVWKIDDTASFEACRRFCHANSLSSHVSKASFSAILSLIIILPLSRQPHNTRLRYDDDATKAFYSYSA